MLDVLSSPLASHIACRRPGYSLEAPLYVSEEAFRADLDLIFGRHWIFVAVEPDIPEPGDVVRVEIGAASVLILRDDDGAVRAFHNVCRHRGARLVHDEKTSIGNLVCRYHAWTYGRDGELKYAKNMGAEFDRSCHRLKPVHVRSLAGLIFVCLAEEPPADFDEMAQIVTPYLAPHDLPGCKVVHQVDLIEHGNWKITMENNRECYHCAVNHPELTSSIFEYGFGFSPDQLDENRRDAVQRYDALVKEMHACWEAAGLASRQLDHLDDRITGFRIERLPMDQAGESQTLDSSVACRKLLGKLADPKLGGLSFWTQPNSWHHFMSDHIVTFSVLPQAPDRTLLRTKWLVRKDAVEGADYDLGRLTEVWEATNRQDSELVGFQHAGVQSAGYQIGPYSPYTEGLVEKFTGWYIGRMAAALLR